MNSLALSSNINTYSDVAAILQQILEAGGTATFTLPSAGKAIQWRQRAYKYRLLLQAQYRTQANIKGYTPPTPYDRMKMVNTANRIQIDMEPAPEGTILLPSGKIVKPEPGTPLRAPPNPQGAAKAPLDITELTDTALQLLVDWKLDED